MPLILTYIPLQIMFSPICRQTYWTHQACKATNLLAGSLSACRFLFTSSPMVTYISISLRRKSICTGWSNRIVHRKWKNYIFCLRDVIPKIETEKSNSIQNISNFREKFSTLGPPCMSAAHMCSYYLGYYRYGLLNGHLGIEWIG